MILIPIVLALVVPLDLWTGRRRRRSEQGRRRRIGAELVLAAAAVALMASCVMTWWEADTSGRLGVEPVVGMTVVALAAAGFLRLLIVLRQLSWGAASMHTVTWLLFLVGFAVANPQLFADDERGEFKAGYFVGLVAAGLVTLAGLIDWPWPTRRRRAAYQPPAGPNAMPAPPITEWPTEPPAR